MLRKIHHRRLGSLQDTIVSRHGGNPTPDHGDIILARPLHALCKPQVSQALSFSGGRDQLIVHSDPCVATAILVLCVDPWLFVALAGALTVAAIDASVCVTSRRTSLVEEKSPAVLG